MKIDKRNLGERINHIRVQQQDTLEQFSNRINETSGNIIKSGKSNVSRWEKGENIPNDITLKAIADIGGKTVNELLHGSIEEQVNSIIRASIQETGLAMNVFMRDRIIRDLRNSGVTIVNPDEVMAEYNKDMGEETYSTTAATFKNTIPEYIEEKSDPDNNRYWYDFLINADFYGYDSRNPVKEQLTIEYEGNAHLEIILNPDNEDHEYKFIGLSLLYDGKGAGKIEGNFLNHNEVDGLMEHLIQSVLNHHHKSLNLTFDQFKPRD